DTELSASFDGPAHSRAILIRVACTRAGAFFLELAFGLGCGIDHGLLVLLPVVLESIRKTGIYPGHALEDFGQRRLDVLLTGRVAPVFAIFSVHDNIVGRAGRNEIDRVAGFELVDPDDILQANHIEREGFAPGQPVLRYHHAPYLLIGRTHFIVQLRLQHTGV